MFRLGRQLYIYIHLLVVSNDDLADTSNIYTVSGKINPLHTLL